MAAPAVVPSSSGGLLLAVDDAKHIQITQEQKASAAHKDWPLVVARGAVFLKHTSGWRDKSRRRHVFSDLLDVYWGEEKPFHETSMTSADPGQTNPEVLAAHEAAATLSRHAENLKSAPVSSLVSVRKGWSTEVFKQLAKKIEKRHAQKKNQGPITLKQEKQHRESCSFSLIFKTRTLDLEAESTADRDKWVEIFDWLRQRETVSRPFAVTHVTHVNKDFEWSGQNLSETFELADKLGEGAFGVVYRAIHKESGIEMAMKMMRVGLGEEIEAIRHEVDILKTCRDHNVVGFYGCWGPDHEQRLWILMELCSLGSIMDVMTEADSVLTEAQVAFVCASVLRALLSLHIKHKIVHRDMKPQNLLVTEKGDIKLSDFGISKTTESIRQQGPYAGPAGSPHYMAPEAITGANPSFPSDIWSLGITAVELAEGRSPFWQYKTLRTVMQAVVRSPPPTLRRPQDVSPQFRDFLRLCFAKDPAQRANVVQLLGHPFIVGASKESNLTPLLPSAQPGKARVRNGPNRGSIMDAIRSGSRSASSSGRGRSLTQILRETEQEQLRLSQNSSKSSKTSTGPVGTHAPIAEESGGSESDYGGSTVRNDANSDSDDDDGPVARDGAHMGDTWLADALDDGPPGAAASKSRSVSKSKIRHSRSKTIHPAMREPLIQGSSTGYGTNRSDVDAEDESGCKCCTIQ